MFDPNASAVIVEEENQSSYMKGVPVPEDKWIDGNSIAWALDHDQSLWGLQNVSKIITTEAVSRKSAPVVHLPHSGKNILEQEFKNSQTGSSSLLKKLLKDMRVDGFIVLKDGKIVTEAYYNGYRPEKRHHMFSVTKSLVGTLAGIMVHEGKIDPTLPVSHYLPELKEKSGIGDATVRQALDMTASLVWDMNHGDPMSNVQLNSRAGGMEYISADFPYANTLSLLQSTEKKDEHGKVYSYTPANTEVLGWIISRLSNKNWQEVFSEKIWSKLGTEHDALVVVDRGGHGFATAGLNATLRDMARFGLMIAQNGYYNDQQIVPSDWIDDIRRCDEDTRNAWKKSEEYNTFGKDAFYRNQFRVLDGEKGIMLALGAKGQMVYTDSSQNLVAVYQSTVPMNEKKMATSSQINLLEQITQYLSTEC